MTSFNYITQVNELEAALGTLTGGPLALDTETYALPEWGAQGSALDCHTGGIALIILLERDQSNPLVIDYFLLREHQSIVNELLIDSLGRSEFLIGANLKFDLKFLRKELGVWFKRVFDVVMASKLIGNATGSKVSRQLGHGYADICRELLNVHVTGKKDLRVSSWGIGAEGRTLESEWWLEKVTYAANDVRHLFPIMDIQRKTLTDPLPHTPLLETNNYVQHSGNWGLDMQDTLDLEMEVVPVIAQMEYNGIPVGENTMGYFQRAIKERLLEVGAELSLELNLDPPMKNPITRKLEPSPKAMSILRSATGLPKLINIGLGLQKITTGQAQVLERLLDVIDALSQFEGEDMQDAAADIFIDQEEAELYDELLELEDSLLDHITPVVRAILEYKKLTKQDGMDLRNFINPATKRIHASYDQLGAATGRLACRSPNLQQQSGRLQIPVTMPRHLLLT
jgi:DNA polymerase I-like protein with 3'-5' exonuclease and polymerase domains